MKLPLFIRWRLIHWRAQWMRLWCVRIHPSPLQREFNRGDPDGNVRRLADEIIRDMKNTGKWED